MLFNKKRNGKTTGISKFYTTAALGIGALALLAGCQPTPKQEVIVQKENINDVVDEYTAESQSSAGGTSLKEQLGVPDTANFDISIANGGKITGTDVPIEMPDTDKAGAATVIRADLSDDELKAMIEKYTGGRTLYEPLPITKERLMEDIKEKQEMINELKASDSPDAQGQIAELEEVIKFRQQSMDSVPSESELTKVPITMEWQKEVSGMGYDSISGENWDEEMQYSVYAVKDASTYSIQLSKSDHPEEEYLTTIATFAAMLVSESEMEQYRQAFASNICQYTEDEAVQMCMEFLEDYGISTDSLMVRSVEPIAWYNPQTSEVSQAEGYEIDLSHGVGDIAQTKTDNHIWYMSEDGSVDSANEGRVTYDYEELTLKVTDDGVVYFRWNNPMKMGEILSESVTLKSFDDVKEIMDNQLATAYESYNSDGYENGSPLEISRISFGMMRIQNEGDEQNYTLIPVWDVYGYIFVSDHDRVYESAHRNSLLTINAMDGSIISRSTGY